MKEIKKLIDVYLGNALLNELFKQNFTAVSRARKEHGYFVLAFPILGMRKFILKKKQVPNTMLGTLT
jgi:hypothetical protein